MRSLLRTGHRPTTSPEPLRKFAADRTIAALVDLVDAGKR
jgi:hypothetical protein